MIKQPDFFNPGGQTAVFAAAASVGAVHILVNDAGGGRTARENPSKISANDFAWVFPHNVFSIKNVSP